MEIPAPFRCESIVQFDQHPQVVALYQRLFESDPPAELIGTQPIDLLRDIGLVRTAVAHLQQGDAEFDNCRIDIRSVPQGEAQPEHIVKRRDAVEFVDKLVTAEQALRICESEDYTTAALARHLAEGVGFHSVEDSYVQIEDQAVKYSQGPDLVRELESCVNSVDPTPAVALAYFFGKHVFTDDQIMQLMACITLDRGGVPMEPIDVQIILDRVATYNQTAQKWSANTTGFVSGCSLFRIAPRHAAERIEEMFEQIWNRVTPVDQETFCDTVMEQLNLDQAVVRKDHLRAIIARLAKERLVCVTGGVPTIDAKNIYPPSGKKWMAAKTRR